MIVWHYTTGQKWPLIVAARQINCARAWEPRERAAAWFSSRPDYEPTARKRALRPDTGESLLLTIDQTEALAGGLVRIGVEQKVSAPHDWQSYRLHSGCSRMLLAELVKKVREMGGDPSEWFASFAPVPIAQWMAVEQRDALTKRWLPMGTV